MVLERPQNRQKTSDRQNGGSWAKGFAPRVYDPQERGAAIRQFLDFKKDKETTQNQKPKRKQKKPS